MLMHTDIAVGRQAIYDRAEIIGYELLFRTPGEQPGRAVGGDQMTASVIFGAMSVGLDQLVGDRRVFVNAERSVLTGELPLLIPPRRTVIEVLETVEVDDEVLDGCRRLAAEGFTLALCRPGAHPSQDQLFPLARIVKVDLMSTPHDELPGMVARLREHDVTLLAERVTSLDVVPDLVGLGFELFQGFAFDRPTLVTGRALTPQRISGLHSAADVLAVDDFDSLEEILRRDPALTHQVLQLASIGRVGETRRAIRAIRDALVLAGSLQVRNWLALLLMLPTEDSTAAEDALVRTLQRARACELLAPPAQTGTAFAAGMLSALDLLLEVPRAEIADKLSLSSELREAAFGGTGPLACLVADVAARQQADRHRAPVGATDPKALDAALAAAFTWATGSGAALKRAKRGSRLAAAG